MAVFDDKKGISVADGFKLQAEKPLDARQQVDTYDQLAELVSGNGAWEGMMVYVVEDKVTYRYDGSGWIDCGLKDSVSFLGKTSSDVIYVKPDAVRVGDMRIFLDISDDLLNSKTKYQIVKDVTTNSTGVLGPYEYTPTYDTLVTTDMLSESLETDSVTTNRIANGAVTIDKIDYDTATKMNYYGICDTAIDTAAKTVTIEDLDLGNCGYGTHVTVRFTDGLKCLSASEAMTLNINNTMALEICVNGVDGLQGLYDENDYITDKEGCLSFVLTLSGGGDDVWALDIPGAVPNDSVSYSKLDNDLKGQVTYYGTCATDTATKDKVVTIDGLTSYMPGMRVAICFTEGMQSTEWTGADDAEAMTLNINGLGAVDMCSSVDPINAIWQERDWIASQFGVLSFTYRPETTNADDTTYDPAFVLDDTSVTAYGALHVLGVDGVDEINIRGNAVTLDKLNLEVKEKLQLFGVCSADLNTAGKTVAIENIDKLADGMKITVLFENGLKALENTALTLNVNDGGAIAMLTNGVDNISASLTEGELITDAGGCLSFVYHTSDTAEYWTLDAPQVVWGAGCVTGTGVISKDNFEPNALNLDVYSELPTANSSNRGKMILRTIDDVDYVYVCRKNGTAYEWVDITGGASIAE